MAKERGIIYTLKQCLIMFVVNAAIWSAVAYFFGSK
jgi:hypothetical protein